MTLAAHAGAIRCTASDGTVVCVDRPLSAQQVDVCLAAIAAVGQTPMTTYAVHIADEGAAFAVTWFVPGQPGRHTTTFDAVRGAS